MKLFKSKKGSQLVEKILMTAFALAAGAGVILYASNVIIEAKNTNIGAGILGQGYTGTGTAKNYVENNLSTLTSLSFHYYSNNGEIELENVVIRFRICIDVPAWEQLSAEHAVTGYGLLLAEESFLNGADIRTATVDSENVIRYTYSGTPSAFTVTEDQAKSLGCSFTGDIYLANIVKKAAEERANITDAAEIEKLRKSYTAAAFITTEDVGNIFFKPVTASAKSIAQKMINGGEYTADSLGGSLYALANI